MKKQTGIFFYLLAAYVFLQFTWWGYHLVDLTTRLTHDPAAISKRLFMVIGEGFVFFTILAFGLWKIKSSIRKEFDLSQRQNNFLLSVTHELKTPLASIRLYLQTIGKRQLTPEKNEELIQQAIQENDRLEKLIDNILNASRIENNALNPIKEELNVTALTHTLLDKLNKRLGTSITMIETTAMQADVDPFFYETILNNIVENSAKYGGISASIEVVLSKERERLVLSISDNGPGISSDDATRIFQKFYRVGNEETRKQKGSGLGLFIVAEFVRIHGGTIEYRPKLPTGSIFKIIF